MGISLYEYQYIADRQEQIIPREVEQIFLEEDKKTSKDKRHRMLGLFNR